jgi:hypothetical protein
LISLSRGARPGRCCGSGARATSPSTPCRRRRSCGGSA